MDEFFEQTRVPLQQQQLLYNGKEIRNSEKLSAVGVKDDDLLMMVSNAKSGYALYLKICLSNQMKNVLCVFPYLFIQ